MNKPTLFLMLGYPGAGKTTTARVIQELTGAVHLWADAERRRLFSNPTHEHHENIELYTVLNKQTENLLASGNSVIFDTSFNFYSDRQRLRELAAKQGAETKLIWVQAPRELAKERATKSLRNEYAEPIPESDFDRLSNHLEEPHPDEPHIKVDGTRVTKEYISQLLNIGS